MSDHGVSGRVALVTGGSRGIGRSISEQLAAAGARVAVNYRSDHDSAAATVGAIQSAGGTAAAFAADVSVDYEVDRLVQEVTGELGPVDLLVNNAGIAAPRAFTEMTIDDWDGLLAVHLRGMFLASHFVVPAMVKQGKGNIITMVGSFGIQPEAN